MTSSATPTDAKAETESEAESEAEAGTESETESESEAQAEPAAEAPVEAGDAARAPWWWRNMPRLIASAAVVTGLGFVGWHERFRITPPTVFMCLGWIAVVEAVLYLWRTGFSAADEGAEDALWWRPVGEADELEREKRSLLKAIKEIEFDHEMGKTTEEDAGEMVRMYRARAIEVIKALDAIAAGGDAGSVRDEVEREVRARVVLAGKIKGKTKGKGKGKGNGKSEEAS